MGSETPLEPSAQQQAVKLRVENAFNRPLPNTCPQACTHVSVQELDIVFYSDALKPAVCENKETQSRTSTAALLLRQ